MARHTTILQSLCAVALLESSTSATLGIETPQTSALNSTPATSAVSNTTALDNNNNVTTVTSAQQTKIISPTGENHPIMKVLAAAKLNTKYLQKEKEEGGWLAPFGNFLRSTGDGIRNYATVGDNMGINLKAIAENQMKSQSQVAELGTSINAKTLTDNVAVSTGNVLRSLGALMKGGETFTEERALVDHIVELANKGNTAQIDGFLKNIADYYYRIKTDITVTAVHGEYAKILEFVGKRNLTLNPLKDLDINACFLKGIILSSIYNAEKNETSASLFVLKGVQEIKSLKTSNPFVQSLYKTLSTVGYNTIKENLKDIKVITKKDVVETKFLFDGKAIDDSGNVNDNQLQTYKNHILDTHILSWVQSLLEQIEEEGKR